MMKATKILFLSLLMSIVSSCTQNDGRIGDLFGSWALREMTEDGTKVEPLPAAVMCFQNEVVENIIYYDREQRQTYGTWSLQEDILYFNYTHRDDNTSAPGLGAYMAPTWLGFPINEITEAKISRLDGGHLYFSIETPDGTHYTYKFERTW